MKNRQISHRCAIGLLITVFNAHSIAQEAIAQERMRLPRLTGPIVLDGISNEPAWKSVEALPLTMNAPTFRGTPTERSEIRIAYDGDYLFVSARMYDSEAGSIQATSLTRDGMNPADDAIAIVLDTFNDNENALAFLTTPEGIRTDWAIFNDAQADPGSFPFNISWNTFWDVKAVRTNEGWFAEMRIPFTSLRFQHQDGNVVMGLIAWRYIARKNEILCFPEIPPKWDWGIIKPSVAQDVLLQRLESRRPFYIAPYVLGGFGRSNELNDEETEYIREEVRSREVGVDVKYGLWSNLTLDLTLNTDFAQVEADDQQVNLTRFSLFFPEKRLFFQERSSVFDFGLGGTIRVFYSRRIGLSESGPVRLLGGARLIGRVADWDVGFLDMQTDKSNDLPSENFSVLRLRRQVINENSYAGAMVTTRLGDNGESNLGYAVDGLLRVRGDDYLVVNWAQTYDDSLSRQNKLSGLKSTQTRFQYEKRTNRGFGYEFGVSHVGEHFNPGIGFAPRLAYTNLREKLFYGWYPDSNSPWYNHVISVENSQFRSDTTGRLESMEFGPSWMANTKSAATVIVGIRMIIEDLMEEFELSDEAMIPVGRYTFFGINGMYQSPFGALLRSSINAEVGTFYDGWRVNVGIGPNWSISEHFEVGGEYQFVRARFPSRSEQFDAHIARLRVKVNVDPEVSASTFIQHSTIDKATTINFRLRYNPREGNDLYLVYNEGINTDREKSFPTPPYNANRTLLLKYSYTFEL